MGFGVWGLGFGVWGLGFGVWGLGFGVWGLIYNIDNNDHQNNVSATIPCFMGGGDLYRVWLPILARLNFPHYTSKTKSTGD
ncbi:hypothetical protein BML2537_36790 [Providencia stuartii]|nr:hypothetical protein BML2537_36790 [Providencia stuartii]